MVFGIYDSQKPPGLLGDIASLMGMLGINILSINGVEDRTRGMLVETNDQERSNYSSSCFERLIILPLTKCASPN